MLQNEGVALRSVHWSEIFPWLSIGKSFRLAVGLRLLVFGGAALLLTLLGWWVIGRAFGQDGAPNACWRNAFGYKTPWQVIGAGVPDRPFAGVQAEPEAAMGPGYLKVVGGEMGDPSGLRVERATPLFAGWYALSRPVLQFLPLSGIGQPIFGRNVVAAIVSAFWSLAVWAFFGAAIARVAAVELAAGERVGWGASLRWARQKWRAYFSAPLIPMIGVALAAAPVALLGLLMKSDFLAAVGGLIWPLALLAACIMTLLLIGVLFGWPLMWATISVEGTDSFDALSRTYAYVFQKPLRYLLYTLIAALVGWLGWIVVENIAAAVVALAAWAAQIDSLHSYSGDSSLAHAGAGLIDFWNGCVKLLALGYIFSYLGVASTAIYYQMRRDVDARETDEVFLDADKSEKGFGLPPLEKPAAGTPEAGPSAEPAVEATGAEGNGERAE